MSGKLYENPAFDSGRENSGRMSFSGSFEFEREIGKRVWFAEEDVHPHDHTPSSAGETEIEATDYSDRAEMETAADEYGESADLKDFKYSYRNLLAWVGNDKISEKQAMNPNDVARFLVRELSRESTLSEYQGLLLETLRHIQNGTRMTEDLHTLLKELEDEYAEAPAGKFLGSEKDQKEKEELLFALRDLQIVGPFTANDDRAEASRGTEKKDFKDHLLEKDPSGGEATFQQFEVDYSALKAKREAASAPGGIALSAEEIHMLEVYDLLFHETRGMTAGLLRELEELTAKASLTPEEQKLKDALGYLQELKPYFDGGGPVDKSRLTADRLSAVELRIFQLAIQSDNLSSQEQRFVLQLQDQNFHGTGMSTVAWLNKGDYDSTKFDLGFMKGVMEAGHTENMPADPVLIQAGQELAELALTVTTLQEKIRIKMQFRQSIMESVDERREMRPRQHIGRQIKGKLRRIRYGIETAFAKNPNKGIAALAAGIGVLGWILTSKNPKVGAFRKAILYGGLGVYGAYGADLWAEAIFGKSPLKAVEEMSNLDAHHLNENLRRIFSDYAKDDKEIENFEVMTGVAKDIPFMELWDRYEQVKKSDAQPKRLEIPGVLNPHLIEGRDNAEAFYEAMAMFDRRYGAFIKEYQEREGIIPLAGMTMLEVVELLVSINDDSQAQKQPFYYLANRFGHGFEGFTSLGGRVVDRLQEEIGNWIGGNKYRLVKYLREILPYKDYGDIEMTRRGESIITLPGGVMTKVRFLYGTKVQDYQPDERVTGFVFYNVDGTEKIFHFGENNPREIEEFCKGLVRDTALKTMPELRDNPEDKKLMEDFYHQASKTLEWNKGEKKWMVPGFKVESKPIVLTEGTTTHEIQIPPSIHNIFLQPYGPLEKATFGLRFYRNDNFWNSEKESRDTEGSLTKLSERIERENFNRWLIRSYHFPFAVDDITVDNYDALRAGGEPEIRGHVNTTSRAVSFVGRYADALTTEQLALRDTDAAAIAPESLSTLTFTFEVNGTSAEEKQEVWQAMLVEIIDRRFGNLMGLAEKMDEQWLGDKFSLKRPWEYFKDLFGGSVSETQWKQGLESKRDMLIAIIQERDITPADFSEVNDTLIVLSTLEEDIQRGIALNETFTANKFADVEEELRMLGYPPAFRAISGFFTTRLENFYEFSPEALENLLSLFSEIAMEEAADGRTVMEVLESTNQAEADVAQKFLYYYTERIITRFNEASKGGILHSISAEEDLRVLRKEIEDDKVQTRSTGGIVPGATREHWPTFAEYFAAPAGSPDKLKYDFIHNVYALQAMWLDYADHVSDPIGAKIAWKPAGFEYAGDVDSDPSRSGIEGKHPIDTTLIQWWPPASPFLTSVLENTFDFTAYDLAYRLPDLMGIYPRGLAGKIKYPTIASSTEFKRMAAVETERLILEYSSLIANGGGSAVASSTLIENFFGIGEANRKITAETPTTEELLYLGLNNRIEYKWRDEMPRQLIQPPYDEDSSRQVTIGVTRH